MAKKIFTVIKEDTLVSIKVSGAYYNRVVDLMTRLLEKQPDPKQALINIDTPTNETPLTISEAVIQTFMMLVKSVEDEANKNLKKHTTEVELDIKEDPSGS
jgi:NADH:ubiquinone oxidoreductase subunit B-like Fe-S oxidoreductase